MEFGDIQNAAFEESQIGGAVIRRVGALTDKLVDVLVALIVSHIDHRAVVGTEARHGPLVLEAPQSGLFYWFATWIKRIDFDDPAETVRLVGMARGIETLVVLVPAVPKPRLGNPI